MCTFLFDEMQISDTKVQPSGEELPNISGIQV